MSVSFATEDDDDVVPVGGDPKKRKPKATSPDLFAQHTLQFEDYNELDAIAERLKKATDEPKGGGSPVQLFYPRPFPAVRLINWLYREKFAAPIATAERLVDANIITLARGNPGFGEGSGYYKITEIKAKVRKLTLMKTIVTGNIIIRGRHRLNNVYCVIGEQKKKLYVLRATKPYKSHSVHKLKGALYYLHPPRVDTDMRTISRALSILSDTEVHRPRRQRSMTGASIGYVTLVVTEPRRRRITLGFESASDKSAWIHALDVVGVVHKQELISEEKDYEVQDILDTPQYKAVFREFLEANHCAEILNFLESVEGYSRVEDPERRLELSRLIFDMFVSSTSAQPVNIDAKTRLEIEGLIKTNQAPPDAFQKAFNYLYYLMEHDVFLRFAKSAEYTKMILEKKGESASRESSFIVKGRGERGISFAMVPDEDAYSELEQLMAEVIGSGIVVTNRKGFKSVRMSFYGANLVTWLMQKGLAKLRPAATAIGQRLLNAAFIVHYNNGGSEFIDSSKELYQVAPETPGQSPEALTADIR